MSTSWDDEVDLSGAARNVLVWSQSYGAGTLGEAYDLLDQLAVSNDVPEVLGADGSVDGVREELEVALELAGGDAPLGELL